MSDQQQNAESAHFRFKLSAEIALNGEDPDYIGQRMNSAFGKAIGNGALTGDTGAEVTVYDCGTTLLTPGAASLDEEQLAAWIDDLIQSGNMELERLPMLMARYALADPAEMREEFAERMGLNTEEPADDVDGAATMAPADR